MSKEDTNNINLLETWKELSEKKFINNPIKKEDIMKAIMNESHSDISLLKKRLKYKLFYCIGFAILFLILLFFNRSNQDLTILFGIFFAAYVIAFIPMYINYRKVDDGLSQDENILETMKRNLNTITSVLRLEKMWGMVFFIPAVIGGILLGRVQSGVSLMECFSDTRILLTMIGLSIVLVPIMTWGSNKANKKAYGGLIENLKNNIVRLETIG